MTTLQSGARVDPNMQAYECPLPSRSESRAQFASPHVTIRVRI